MIEVVKPADGDNNPWEIAHCGNAAKRRLPALRRLGTIMSQ
jgi:hypothetical protein